MWWSLLKKLFSKYTAPEPYIVTECGTFPRSPWVGNAQPRSPYVEGKDQFPDNSSDPVESCRRQGL